MKFIIITKKKWDIKNFNNIKKNIFIFDEINLIQIKKINPKIIFFIHWSKIIKESLFEKYLCIQFHASNLPTGRGGSPIQNQILQNIKKTKLTAFKISKKLDSGPICLQEDLMLAGDAEQILKKIEIKSIKMINKIIKIKKLKFKKQVGKPSYFKRRKPLESRIDTSQILTIDKLYDFLRMLDAPGYPGAFIELNKFKFIFNNIKKINSKLSAEVIISINEK
jgi:methionyl-tRNA formyltransferase